MRGYARVRSVRGRTMFERLDEQRRLTRNQKKIIAAAIMGDALEFFDYFLIGFVLAFIIGPWHLTYGQSAIILLSSGIGAMIGAGFWGWLADRIGRRRVFIATVLNFSVATGLLALTPDNGWIYLTVFRFVVGFGVGGLYAVDLPLVQEFVPTSQARLCRRHRDRRDPGRRDDRRRARCLPRPRDRLARAVPGRAGARRDDLADPRLGPGIAALAGADGTARGGAPLARLGDAGVARSR